MADDNRGGGSTAIIVALIGTAGVVAAALIGTFGRNPPNASPTGTQTAGGSSSPVGSATQTGKSEPDPSAAPSPPPAARPNPTHLEPLPPPKSQPAALPNFAGAWTLEGNANQPIVNITQTGNSVQIGGRAMLVQPDGSVGYQSFYASDQKSGHPVQSIDQADLVDTFNWSIKGDELVFRTVFDTRHPYFNQPVGKVLRVMRYRRAD